MPQPENHTCCSLALSTEASLAPSQPMESTPTSAPCCAGPTHLPPPTASVPGALYENATFSNAAENIHIRLTYDCLSLSTMADLICSPSAGAIVLFLGTTWDTFSDLPVMTLSYSCYMPLCLRMLTTIAREIKKEHNLYGIAFIHRLGDVKVGEETVHIAVSSKHRKEAWLAGEEALEEVKKHAEIWKREVFQDGSAWRSNRDGERGVRI
ncbi:Similar to Molybdopterin synthase catalytic subunit; acc. no. Q1DQS9 [Pyronema omphalodes CBS 100304]|uniref:Similar to Molybdopterin synthase catalytic subunit acc. no. Q1DQS9 n=1 Tax=Pyronema omphalodes (strain CBS 100304) TaxID=1076935 RepID=U4LB81_PYROM|nr:Similar to Molybdopterin synthase catalytic subunit; acc. no. Q1DQS9 [Pyronema omphalodes CBS 100304]